MSNHNTSRRNFLKHGGATAAVAWTGFPLVANLSMMGDAHAATSDYRALVCIYLAGGNDSFSTLWRDDATSVAGMNAVRPALGPDPDKWSYSYVDSTNATVNVGLPISATGSNAGNYRLHPKLTALQTLYGLSELTFVGGVGPLKAVTTRDTYSLGTSPRKLYSHNDQTAIWQTGEPDAGLSTADRVAEGVPLALQTLPPQGWAAQMLGSLPGVSGYSAVGIEATPPLLSCSAYSGAGVSAVGTFGLGREGVTALSNGYQYGWALMGMFDVSVFTPVWSNSYRASAPPVHEFEKAYAAIVAKAHTGWSNLKGPLAGATVKPLTDAEKGANGLRLQLQSVARMINAQATDNVIPGRQVFFVQLGGFDTHDGQVRRHGGLMGALNDALAYFKEALGDNWGKTVAFTASEFGRKLRPNGDGCDHGWGGHHIVAGGGIAGGKILGHVPSLAADLATGNCTDTKMLPDGTFIPTVPVEQYAAYVSQWLGVSTTTISGIFPKMGDKTTAGVDLGVLRRPV
jgi:uncharacterized protein (DUF1501 family)